MTPPNQLPAILEPRALTTSTDGPLIPALIGSLGEAAAWRYVEFFTANIRNPNTRRAYARACARFLAWCDGRGLTLSGIRPHDVATYIETLQAEASGAEREATASRHSHAVRLARDRPGDADQPGGGRARTQPCRQDRHDAGA
jgi:Phage integrase, N-terminal SAM-like domain